MIRLGMALHGWLRLFGQGLSLSLLRKPRSRVELAGFGDFVACALGAFACYATQDYLLTEKPAEIYRDGFFIHATYAFLLLAITWLQSRLLARPALWLNLAALLSVALIPLMLFWNQLPILFSQADDSQLLAWKLLLGMMGFAIILRTLAFVAAGSGVLRVLAATLLGWLLLAWPWQARQDAWLWYAIDQDNDAEETSDTARQSPVPEPTFDPETVASHQSTLLDSAIADLQAQDPKRVDLYSIGFAGDGSETVFRNEVGYLGLLLSQRLGAGHRHLSLVNHADSVDSTPLATLTNLRLALKGVAKRMDVQQDVLFLYLTSHGSKDHQLKVDLAPIPMHQITAGDLRKALDEAGIGWRVLVVSACYSGGFIDELKDTRTLVITAARRDRTSFGCGADSDITWFGRAFLTQALNETSDPRQAFAIASRQVREWELQAGNQPSVPQMSEGALIGAQLEQWRAGTKQGAPVAFSADNGPSLGEQ